MSARARMTQRMVLEKNTATTLDGFNNPPPPDWVAHITIPCFAWSRTKTLSVVTGESARIEDFRAQVPWGADVTEAHRIASIRDRRNVIKFPGPIRIDTKQPKTEGATKYWELNLTRVAS